MDCGVAGVDVAGCGVAAGWGGIGAAAAAAGGFMGAGCREGVTRRELEARNLRTVAEAMVQAAVGREESRGAHFSTDFSGTTGECSAALGSAGWGVAVCGAE